MDTSATAKKLEMSGLSPMHFDLSANCSMTDQILGASGEEERDTELEQEVLGRQPLRDITKMKESQSTVMF